MVTAAARIGAALRHERQGDGVFRRGPGLGQHRRALVQPIQQRAHPLGHTKGAQREHRFVHLSGKIGSHVQCLPRSCQPIHNGPKANQDLIDARHAPRLPSGRFATVEA